jgi:hypothetical protein
MALEWLGDFARKINNVMTTPSPRAQQIAEQFPQDNPYRLPISQMTGTPSVDVLRDAANYQLDRDKFNATTLPVGPETFKDYDPNNPLAKILGQNPRRYSSNIVTGAFDTEDKLKKQAEQANAIQESLGGLDPKIRETLQSDPRGSLTLSMLNAMEKNPRAFDLAIVTNTLTNAGQTAKSISDFNKQLAARQALIDTLKPYEAQIKSTPRGVLLWNSLTTPNALPGKQFSTAYEKVGDTLQGGLNRSSTKAAAQQVISQMPDGVTKQILTQLLPIMDLPGGEALFSTVLEGALKAVPQPAAPLSPKDIADINLKKSQTWRNYNVFPENSGSGNVNFWSGFGFNSAKDASAWATNIEKAYAIEAKNNGGRLDRRNRWTFPTGKPMSNINNWIKQRYGENTLRKYKAVKTGEPAYLDTSRSLIGIMTPGLIQNEWDLAADQLVTQFRSFAKAKKYAISTNKDKRLIAALDRRERILQQHKK